MSAAFNNVDYIDETERYDGTQNEGEDYDDRHYYDAHDSSIVQEEHHDNYQDDYHHHQSSVERRYHRHGHGSRGHDHKRRRSVLPAPAGKRPRGHKPTSQTKLKSDGSNYAIWLLKLRAAFRYAGIEHVLQDPPRHCKHPREERQLALDILLDLVEDALASKVVRPGSLDKSPDPKAVLDKLHQTFGTACATMHSTLRASIQVLKQGSTESVSAYMLRAEDLFDRLKTAGGHMSTKTFLQALKEGVLPCFNLTVRFFEREPRQTVALLSGALQAEENSMARQKELRGTAPDTSLALQDIAMPEALRRTLSTLLAVTEGGGSQKWKAKSTYTSASEAKRHQEALTRHAKQKAEDPERYAALEALSTCFNCGAKGHRLINCTKPIVKPYKFGNNAQPKPAAAGAAAPVTA
jgi:hypothetical protein